MNRDYTIHEYKGVRFINLSKRDIVTEDGEVFPAERYTKVKDGEEIIISSTLRSSPTFLFNREPENLSPRHVYIENLTFSELIHLPHPEDVEWLESLPEGVLVISNIKSLIAFGFPVCMFRTKQGDDGKYYHYPTAVLWSKTT